MTFHLFLFIFYCPPLVALAPGAELLYDGIWRLGGVRQQWHKLSEPTAVCRVEEWRREGLGTPREEKQAEGLLLTFLMLEGEGSGYVVACWAGDLLLLI